MEAKDAAEPILFISNKLTNPNAGTESQLLTLIRHLPRDRFRPKLLVLQSSEFTDSGLVPCEVDVLGYSRLQDPRTWLAFWRYSRKAFSDGYGLAHIYFHDPSVFGPPLLHKVGIRTIISRRDMGYWYNHWYLWVLRMTGRFASKVVVNSHAVGEVTAKEERIPREKLEIIYNGYESSGADNQLGARDIRKIRDNGFGPMIFLVANYRPLKRVEDAIRALNVVGEQGGSAQLVIIGSGDWEPLRLLANELGIGQKVHFLGRRRDVQACLALGAIGLLCSESEGYSNSIVEYMQAGLPVVVSDVGGNKEAVPHGETGFRYNVGDTQALAGHLLYLLNNPEVADQMGHAGQTLADQRHNLQGMINAYVELYQAVLDDNEGTPLREKTK